MQFSLLFSENHITDDELLELSKEDLADLIPSIGHRSKLSKAIVKLKSGSIYVCFKCTDKFRNLRLLSLHLTKFHKLKLESEYKCPHCNGSFARRAYLGHFANIFKLHSQLLSGVSLTDCHTDLLNQEELEEKDDEFLSPPKLEDFSGPESVIHFESCIAKLYASILESGKIPMVSCTKIMSVVKESIAEVIKISEFRNSYNGNPTKYSPVRDLLAVFDQFSSRYKMDKYLLSRNFMIEPKEIVLDTDISFQSRSLGSRKQEYKNVTMQYISIKKSIQQLLRKPGFFSILQTNSNFNGENFSCFRDGKFVRDFNQPRETIFINLYYDDAEVANPLGSKSGKHKLANFYFSIIDLPQHLLSKLDNVILVASLKTEDLKLCSPNSVLRVITNELKELWEEGILFVHNGEQINLKIALAQVCGDNLGLHTLLGFSEGFNANYPCRRCKMHKKECQSVCFESKSKLRTVANYSLDVEINNLSETGLNFSSILNTLPYFHVINNFVFDIMHDLFEGVVPDLFHSVVNYLVSKNKLSVDKLNYRLESYDFGRHYGKSRPSQIKPTFMKGETKSGQNASQNICIALYLPILLGDLIDTSDKTWSLFLLLNEIARILLANFISSGGLVLLDSLIAEFLHQYQDMIRKPLKPKHHHMLHYSSAIKQIGPLRQFWSMPFEARHKFFKTTAHVVGNFKNISKSLAYRFQLSRCFKLLSLETFSPHSFACNDYELINLADTIENELLLGKFSKLATDQIVVTTKITKNGSDFEVGGYILLEYCREMPIFGRIDRIILDNDDCHFVVKKFSSEYIAQYAGYKLYESGLSILIDSNDVKYFQCFYSAISFSNDSEHFIILPIIYI